MKLFLFGRSREFRKELLQLAKRSRKMNDYEVEARMYALKAKYPEQAHKFFKKKDKAVE